jgi:hypothetical protein
MIALPIPGVARSTLLPECSGEKAKYKKTYEIGI